MNIFNKIGLSITPGGRKILKEYNDSMVLQNALKDPAKRESLKEAVMKLAQQTRSLTEQDIQSWRIGHATALNVDNPNRNSLYSVYHDAMLDSHLSAVWGVRLEMVLKSRFVLVDQNGKEDTEKTKLLQKSWFLDYLILAMESKLWGHSLIQFTERNVEGFLNVDLVPREHVKPEKGIVTVEPNDEKGVSYFEPPFSDYTVSVGKRNDLGLLLEIAPLCISNKYMGQFWDQFAEIFSVPIRIAKVPEGNTTAINKAYNMLDSMGRAAFGVFGKETDVQIIETSKNDAYNVYDKRMQRNENRISKMIVGNTMLMDNGSSRSQAQVHQEVAEYISIADHRFLHFHMNETLLPFLIKHGYPVQGLIFKWDDSNELSFDEQLKVDQWLAQNFEVDIEYFKEKYNGKITGFKTNVSPNGGGEAAGK